MKGFHFSSDSAGPSDGFFSVDAERFAGTAWTEGDPSCPGWQEYLYFYLAVSEAMAIPRRSGGGERRDDRCDPGPSLDDRRLVLDWELNEALETGRTMSLWSGRRVTEDTTVTEVDPQLLYLTCREFITLAVRKKVTLTADREVYATVEALFAFVRSLGAEPYVEVVKHRCRTRNGSLLRAWLRARPADV